MRKGNLMLRNSNVVGRGLLIAALMVVGLAVAVPANAISFNFTSDHCTGTCGTAPFGTVTLTQNGTTVDVDVHLFSPNFFAKTGAADFEAFKFNATGVVLGDINVNQNAVGQTLAAQELCSALRPYMKRHHVQTGVGHYGVFSGRRWSNFIYPIVRNTIYASD